MNVFVKHIADVCNVSVPITVEIKGLEIPGSFLDLPPNRCVALEVVKALPNIVHEDVAEELIRYLAGCNFAFDGRPLLCWYDKSTDTLFKWAVANTLSFGKAEIDIEWLRKAMGAPAIGNEKQMLYNAIVQYLPEEEALKIIEDHFDEEPIHAISALLKLRHIESVSFLENKAIQPEYRSDPWFQRRVRSVIDRIQKRPKYPKAQDTL